MKYTHMNMIISAPTNTIGSIRAGAKVDGQHVLVWSSSCHHAFHDQNYHVHHIWTRHIRLNINIWPDIALKDDSTVLLLWSLLEWPVITIRARDQEKVHYVGWRQRSRSEGECWLTALPNTKTSQTRNVQYTLYTQGCRSFADRFHLWQSTHSLYVCMYIRVVFICLF